ncbi:MFS transporter [Halarcobacter ebronensis]|uniref:MFS transporter n=1 Tax=Halarcobacter ebronensis TaxID=1462615 RepID=A0A4Q1AQK1_9BACT|nr:MFS transporter [Halarcobacter ebronensis]QKF82969.1 major facilitator superfamily transporter [Halarcobacter ebronensis]RXK02833.1 MFS transporter [Halarcobacter ebronensis]
MKTKTFLIYALLAMPLSIVGLPLYIYLPTFYATQININIATVGLILFIARLSDVFTDPLIGYLSDISQKKFNSKKPIMLIGSIMLIFSFYALINPNMDFANLWLLIFSILIYFAWSLITIPYLTWSSELSNDYYEKTKLNSYRESSTIIGLVLALVLPYFFTQNIIKEKLDSLFYIFTFLFIPFLIITMLTIKTQNSQKYSTYNFNDIKMLYKKIPNLKSLQVGYFLNNLANAIPATLFLLFIETIIEKKEFADTILILYFIAGVIALPFWTLLSKRIGKKRVWIYSIILACSAFFFVVFLQKGDLLLFSIISFLSGLCLGADIAFPTSIQADIVQKSKSLEKNYSGLLFGIWTMLTKFALAISVVIAFGILGLVDFNKDELTKLSIYTLIFLYGFLPILLKLFSLFFIRKYADIID